MLIKVEEYTFSPQYRIRRPAQYQRVFKGKPLSITGRCFRLLSLPNSFTHARLGVIVSKRCSKLAVRRNLVKRIVRERFRQQQHVFSNVDIIVIANQYCFSKHGDQTAEQALIIKQRLRKDIDKLWQRLVTKMQ